MNDLTRRLRRAYAKAMPTLTALSKGQDGISGPLFLCVPDGYRQTAVRLMIVGQQTCKWPSITIGVDGLLRAYRDFDFGRHYTASPFWQACHQVFAALNPDGPERAFVWSNLVRVDQHKRRPTGELEESVCRLGLLQYELQVLQPDVVLFFTGPSYAERLRESFPGVKTRGLGADAAVLRHPDLPTRSFLTYHPHYLWRARKHHVLQTIVQRAGSARQGSSTGHATRSSVATRDSGCGTVDGRPRRLTIEVGGFMGPSFVVKLSRGKVTYSVTGEGYQNERSELIPVGEKRWKQFRASLDALGVWNWRPHYRNPGVCDGAQWRVKIEYDDRKLNCHGDNCFPRENGSRSDAPDTTGTFQRFLEAVSALIGGREFR